MAVKHDPKKKQKKLKKYLKNEKNEKNKMKFSLLISTDFKKKAKLHFGIFEGGGGGRGTNRRLCGFYPHFIAFIVEMGNDFFS